MKGMKNMKDKKYFMPFMFFMVNFRSGRFNRGYPLAWERSK
jgi:hypothetical protein